MSAPQPCFPVTTVTLTAAARVSSSSSQKKRRRSDKHNNHNNNQDDDDDEIRVVAKKKNVVLDLFHDISSLTADEYLSRVVTQARQLPDVFVASTTATATSTASTTAAIDNNSIQTLKKKNRNTNEPPIDGCAASLSYMVSDRMKLLPAPSAAYLPTPNALSWVNTTLENFVRLRDYLNNNNVCRTQQHIQQQRPRLPVPPMKDRAGWHTFCVGHQDAQGNEGAYFDDYDINNDNHNEDTNNNNHNNPEKDRSTTTSTTLLQSSPDAWKLHLPEHGYKPDVRLLLQLDQVMVRKVLQHLSYYVQEGWSIARSYQRAAWIYALLARLEKPIHRDDASTLYGLLKKLLQVRAGLPIATTTTSSKSPPSVPQLNHIDEPSSSLARINLLIAIIGVYFEQGGFQNVFTTTVATTDD